MGPTPETQGKLIIIKDELQQGKSQIEIAAILGISKGAINEIIRTWIPNWRDLKPTLETEKRTKLTDLEVAQHTRFQRKRVTSKKTGYEWALELEDVYWPKECPILGLTIDYFASSRQENSASFDRIDNTKGYVKGNVHIISWRANRIKNDGTAFEHRQIAEFLDMHNAWLDLQDKNY